MTTVKKLKEYLDTLPEETEVMVIEQHDSGCYGTYGAFVALDLHPYDGNTDFVDMTGNQFAKGKDYENNKTLYLGMD